ncbi:uncharacterized protein GIQ15_05981 [Arthroderma uncinatum]|uniref:uncharacterized protein n=1 Tax=Arthroderma uncinatum TaxID=74035 RepID=UPI00144ADAD3|nr:uncharacterized protein GIQ15_05981 [Arthroderma uncinatum]KAF3480634.1 hypothetical protein GIQ15_05981 [Arthroderma uncinatum]
MSSYTRDPSNAARVRARRSLAQMPHRGGGIDIDKENVTTDLSAVQKHSNIPSRTFGKDKRSRSKSLGPGGLDLLKNGGNDRRKSTAAVQLKSILKPTIPVSPISHIPTFAETRRKTPSRDTFRIGHKASGNNDLLIDFSTPTAAPVVGTDSLINPFDNFNPIPPSRAKDEALAAQREREEKMRVENEREKKKAILEQRAARRKSMANRRVSFAPEATLHTWNVVELMEDSTASSAANTTRRASSLAAGNMDQGSDAEPPSSPEKYDQEDAPGSHAAAELDDLADEAFSSSPFSGGSAADNNDAGFQGGNMEVESDSLSSGPEDESTNMSLDNATERSLSPQSDGSTPSSSSLERSLRRAAETAGTRGIDFDENGDLSMEFTNHEIVGAFQPWVKKGSAAKFDAEDLTSRLDQENITPANTVAPSSSRTSAAYQDDGDMSMDITKAVGGIVRRKSNFAAPDDQDSRPYSAFQNNKAPLRRASAVTNLGDQTMEFTDVLGGIKGGSPSKQFDVESNIDTDEEMTMEFTNVLGGVLNKQNLGNENDYIPQERAAYDHGYEGDVTYPDLGEDDMEMTGAVGGILPPIEERTEPSEDGTMGMDMTNAVGKILAPFHVASQKGQRGMQHYEADPPSSPFQEKVAASPAKLPLPLHTATVTSESGSPVRTRARSSVGSRRSSSPRKSLSRQSSPARGPSTPLKQKPVRHVEPSTPATPEGSPIRPRSRSASPQKRRPLQLNQPPAKSTPVSLFQKNALTGQSTPTFVLKALNLSTQGVNKAGLGSPRVTEILDRRRSIGEDAQDFVLKPTPNRGVRFDDPRKLGPGVEKDIEEEIPHRASQESEKDTTLNLRELISSLTPKKSKLKGRKSLHVGAARGLLGKRPAELDMDDADEDLTPKRLRGREASPVKNIKLPAPPSKAETVGRPSRLSLHYARSVSPLINASLAKQRSQAKELIVQTPDDKKPMKEAETEEENMLQDTEPRVDAIKLSDFLEMTNIHFMELTTTKRRHTIAPGSPDKRDIEIFQGGKVFNLEDRVAAGFCTVPMLELYQHSCRELKSYISEGRRIIRSIEAETYAENPPLFQEYITATPDIRLLMDNQFRNVKTHARLLSKEMWYEWRMKLLEGLKQGLDRHVDEMKQDDILLSKKENILAKVVPGLTEKHARLEIESHNLQKVMDEIENCDQEELRDAREKLATVETELEDQKQKYEHVRDSLEKKSNVLETGQARKEKLLQQIRDAEGIIEECRGWNVKEVRGLRASVQALEKRTGWTVLSARPGQDVESHTTLSMRYAGELRLDFIPKYIRGPYPKSANEGRRISQLRGPSPITLTFSPSGTGSQPVTAKPSPEVSLVLNAIRTRILHSTQISVSPKLFLNSIAKSWGIAASLREEIRMLGYCGITTTKSAGINPSEPTLLKVRCMLLGWVGDKKTPSVDQSQSDKDGRIRVRIDIDFTVKPKNHSKQLEDLSFDIGIDVDASASRVYGLDNCSDSSKSDSHLSDFLAKSIDKSPVTLGNGLWRAAVKALGENIFL